MTERSIITMDIQSTLTSVRREAWERARKLSEGFPIGSWLNGFNEGMLVGEQGMIGLLESLLVTAEGMDRQDALARQRRLDKNINAV